MFNRRTFLTRVASLLPASWVAKDTLASTANNFPENLLAESELTANTDNFRTACISTISADRQYTDLIIVSPDAESFRKSQEQIQNELGRAAALANRRNG